ncbi:SDR family oxidoreductase [Planococcus sp. CAU13]|uniref:SDR family oxidoreductase n=1 Tax=Planococcus sp. CAU13 TaxID=1541197 RepID=UPI001F452ABE|nr:SDR family oxidoreductase [Planococcus sp. CAU13]
MVNEKTSAPASRQTGEFKKLKLKKLQDQVIVLTGASSGIGLSTARMAAAKGAKMVLAARNEEALKELTEELRNQGHQAIWVKADVGNEEDVNRIAETALREFGRFDTWINNAGVSIFGKAMDVTIADFKRDFDTNFWGVVYGSRAAVNHFKERGEPGALINIGTVYGDRGVVLQSTYSASKFAVHGFTENLRMELEKEKAPVSVTLVRPGRIDTPYNEHARSYLDKQPAHIGMMYAPEAVADAILFAAEHPKRDMFVGFQAKFGAFVGNVAPRFMDKFMELTMFRTQQSERPSRSVTDNALYEPGYGMHERGTNKGWVRTRSLYVMAEKHPVLASMAIAGIGSALWNGVFKKRY